MKTKTNKPANRPLLLAFTVVALTSLALIPTASADTRTNEVINGRTGIAYTTLQAAINAALPNDTLVVKGTCVGTSTIDRNLTVQGAGKATLDGNLGGAVINVNSGVTVTVNALTIIHGSSNAGGGIYNAGGALMINNSLICTNNAGFGGGIYNILGTLAINNSTISGNTASSGGGGIYNAGTLTINNSLICTNNAGFGGGIYNILGGPLTMNNSAVTGNFPDDIVQQNP